MSLEDETFEIYKENFLLGKCKDDPSWYSMTDLENAFRAGFNAKEKYFQDQEESSWDSWSE